MYDLCPNQICSLLRIVENEVRGTESVNSSNIYCCMISADFLGLHLTPEMENEFYFPLMLKSVLTSNHGISPCNGLIISINLDIRIIGC